MAQAQFTSSHRGAEQRAGTVRLTVAAAEKLVSQALLGAGFTDEETAIIRGQLLTNALDGYEPAGLSRALAIIMEPRSREARYPIRVIHETPSSALLDGGNNVGYLAVYKGMQTALEKVRKTGFAIVGVSNCPFSGRNAYYIEQLVRAGYVAFHTTSGMPHVLPPGGKKAVFGTNPISFAFPTNAEDPIIFDMSTSSMMWGDVLLRARTGEPIPEGIGFDGAGEPSTDASAVAKGGILPFGGHKGYGLSFVVQALGLLAGSYLPRQLTSDYGALFIVVDPELLMPREAFTEHLAMLVRDLKNSPRQDGVDEIVIPSERAFRQRRKQIAEDFIDIDAALHDALRDWGSGRLAPVIQPVTPR